MTDRHQEWFVACVAGFFSASSLRKLKREQEKREEWWGGVQKRKHTLPLPFLLANFWTNSSRNACTLRRLSDLSHRLLSCFFYVLQEENQLTVLRRGLWGFSSLYKKTRMFNHLQMWNKGSTFSSLISRPRVLMQQEIDRGESLRVFPVSLSISMESNFIDIKVFV